MKSLTDEFVESIRERRLFKPRQPILVAVSGGLDSMVLLDLMHHAAGANGWRLTVAHLNHRLRGKSSNADACLVERTARKLGWPAIIGGADVRETARREKLSLEMAARKARHEFLAETAAQLRIRTVALAHHADDQLELFFLRLLRGSGSQGLAGMQWRNPSPWNKRIELVRPLLGQSRAVLAKYAMEHKVPFREDASNTSLDIQRNRIRHRLLPLLKRDYQPALEAVLARLLDIIGAEAQFVTEAAQEWTNRTRNPECGMQDGFEDLAVAVQRRVLQVQLLSQGIIPDFHLVEQLRLQKDRLVSVSSTNRPMVKDASNQLFLLRDREGKIHQKARHIPVYESGLALIDLEQGVGEASFAGGRVAWKVVRGGKRSFSAGKRQFELFDVDRIGNRILLRHWQPGDRFQPIGMSSEVKLQDFFVNQKVPWKRRHELVLGISAAGEVFWVEGMRISERFKLTAATNRRLQWRWQRL